MKGNMAVWWVVWRCPEGDTVWHYEDGGNVGHKIGHSNLNQFDINQNFFVEIFDKFPYDKLSKN